MLAMLFDILRECHNAGIKVKVVTTDMASENQALWRLLNIFGNRNGHNCLFPSPSEPNTNMIFMPDPPHAIKNLKGACMKYSIQVPQWLFEKYNLQDLDPLTNIKMKMVIEKLIEIQKSLNVVLVDGLDDSIVNPDGFEKMRMKFTLRIINFKVVAAIEMCVAEGKYLQNIFYISI